MIFNHYWQHTLLTLLLIPISTLSRGAKVNRTIDDTFGDSVTHRRVSYLPTTPGVWNDQSCSECAIRPDTNLTYMGTYTAATYFKQTPDPISISINFNGTAIYVYFILINNGGPYVVSSTAANFTLDKQLPQLRSHTPDMSTTTIDYNACIFHQENLSNTEHTLVISTSGIQEQTYVNFDYAEYTYEEPELPSNSKASLGLIGGTVAGGVLAVSLLIVGLIFLRRRNNRFKRLYATSLFSKEIDPDTDSVDQYEMHGTIEPFPYSTQPLSGYSTGATVGYGATLTAPVSSGGPQDSKVEVIRRARQEELQRRLQAAQHEMTQVHANISSSASCRSIHGQPVEGTTGPATESRSREGSIDDMKETLRLLQLQVQRLEQQRQSAWAQGLSDSPPPGYAPERSTVRTKGRSQ